MYNGMSSLLRIVPHYFYKGWVLGEKNIFSFYPNLSVEWMGITIK